MVFVGRLLWQGVSTEQWEEDVGFCLSNKGWLAEIIQMIGERRRSDSSSAFLESLPESQSCSGLLCWDCLYLHMQRILLFWAHRWQDRAINHPQILPPCNRRPLQNMPPRRECRCASFRIFKIPEEAPSWILFVKTTSIFNRYPPCKSASLLQYSLDVYLMMMTFNE